MKSTFAALLAMTTLGLAMHAQAWQQYNVALADSTPLDASYRSEARDVNAAQRQLVFLDASGPGYAYQVCVNGACSVLTPPVAGDWAVSAMSNYGQVAGSVYQGGTYAFAGATVIGYDRPNCPGCGFSLWSVSSDINSFGEATGAAEYSVGGGKKAFRYTAASGMVNLGTLGGTTSQGRSLNEWGSVAGDSTLPGDLVTHAFRHDATGMTDLGTLGGPDSHAYSINDFGKVVGCSVNAASVLQAFRAGGASMVGLPGLDPSRPSCAYSINNGNVAVGYGTTSTGAKRAVIFAGSNSKNLNLLLAPGNNGWTLVEATGINDSGMIVGNGIFNGMNRAFVLTPTP